MFKIQTYVILLYTSVPFDSYTMQVQKFVSFMFRTKFWPVKVNSDGVIVHDFVHPAFVLPFALYLACLSVVLYFIGPSLIHSDYTKFSVVLKLILISLSMIVPLSSNRLTQTTICSMKTWDSNTSAEMSLAFCCKNVGFIVLRICMVISLQLQVFPYPSCDNITEHIIYWICVTLLQFYYVVVLSSQVMFNQVCAIIMENELQTAYKGKSLSASDLRYLNDMWTRFGSAISNLGPMLFLGLQLSFIVGSYLVIKFQGTFPFYIVLMFIDNYYRIHTFLDKIENCYTLNNKIAARAREESADCKSVSEMIKIQATVLELESCVPLTGKGYFTIEKSTITSLAANTLTYLIVLLQFNFE